MDFFRNASDRLLTNTAMVPVEVLISIMLARFLPVDERGLYAVAMTFGHLGAILALFGWPAASIYRLRRVGSESAQVAGAALVATLLFASLFVGGSLLLGPWIRTRLLEGAPSIVLYLICGALPFLMLTLVFGGIARGVDRFRFQNIHRAGLQLGRLVLFTAAFALWGSELVGILTIFVSLEVVAATALVGAVLHVTGLSLRFDTRELADSFRFGIKNYLQTFAARLHDRVDIFMLAVLLGDARQVAFYAIASSLVTRLYLAPDALAAAAFPQMAGLSSEDAANFACRICRRSVVLVLLGSAGLASVAPVALPLIYGQPYQSSVAPFLVLMPGVILLMIYRILSRYFAAIDRHQANITTQAISVAVNIALNLWWIPRFGILGAAGASFVSYALEAVLIAVVFLVTTGHRPAELLLPRRDDMRAYQARIGSELRRWGLTNSTTGRGPAGS